TIEGTQWLAGNNLHVDEEFSRRNMFGGVVGDGNQTIQYLCQVITDSLPWGSLVSGYSSLDAKLTNPTRPGDEVVASGSIVKKFSENGRDYVVCEVKAVKRQDSVVAVGTFKVHVPRLERNDG
ncbi:MAG: MaoC family dehydratase, partial [Burkholderiales bacterium]|nr:MaoC family dehydratase [Burkholderiales bacterium]